MRHFITAAAILAMATSAVADDKKKEEPRFKVSFGVAGAQLTGQPSQARAGALDYSFRADDGLQQWVLNFRDEYLRPRGAEYIYFNPPVLARCCANDSESFRVGPNGFTGRIGDEYVAWERGTLNGISERGHAFGGSLEYRATGPLWLSFAVQRTRETALEYSVTHEVFRVEDIGLVPCGNCAQHGVIPSTYVEFSRNRVVRNTRQSYRSTSFAALAKVDLVRGNDHWSVLPQAGLDLLVSREQFVRETEFSRWPIFHGEAHPSDWARRLERVGETKTKETRGTRYVVRPVAGLALELYPAKKSGHFAVLADGRYHFGGSTSYEHNGPREELYWAYAPVRAWTLSLGALVKF